MTKHDPGAYSVVVFDRLGRRRGIRIRANFMQSVKLAERWKRMTGGSAVVIRCIYNTEIRRELWASQPSR